MKIVFSKKGDIRFISHLDLMRLFQRAARRAGLPVAMTRGFSPRMKISITKALKLGLESDGEEAVFHMDKAAGPKNFIDLMNQNLPEGIRIIRAEESG